MFDGFPYKHVQFVHGHKLESISYPCDECCFRTYYRGAMVEHVKRCHPTKIESGLECKYCLGHFKDRVIGEYVA